MQYKIGSGVLTVGIECETFLDADCGGSSLALKINAAIYSTDEN